MAYGGQNSDMSVPAPEGTTIDETGLLDLTERFHQLHQADRGFAFRNQQPIVRGVRLMARGATPKPTHLAEMGTVTAATAKGSRPVFFGVEFIDTPCIDGTVLGPGFTVTGPALVEEAFTVVAVPPGWTATLGEHASYELLKS
jgi:N-methylhydantoinase A